MSDAMYAVPSLARADTGPEMTSLGEVPMAREESGWEAHRLFHVVGESRDRRAACSPSTNALQHIRP
jgi:hypothetical protein